MISLRSYQTKNVTEIVNHWSQAGSNARSVLYVLPTGGGKTYTFCYIAQQLQKRQKNILILVHRDNLVRQSSESLTSLGISHGIIAAGYTPNILEHIQVASVQTLARRIAKIKKQFDFIVVDECHHIIAGAWKTVVDAFPSAKILGVTATPERLDGKKLGIKSGGIFEQMVLGPAMADLVVNGYLSRARYFTFGEISDVGVKMKGGDFDAEEMALRVDKPTITGDAVKHYTRHCAGAPAVAFCCNVKHAIDVAKQFEEAGYKTATLAGPEAQSKEFQRDVLSGLASGKYHVVTTCEIISEGTDVPAMVCAILLRPTQSLTLYLQQVGRVLRVATDSAGNRLDKFVHDHVGNIWRHDHPLKVRDWEIEEMITCVRCEHETYFIHLIDEKFCPKCGDRFEKKRRKKKNDRVESLITCDRCFLAFEKNENNVCPECKNIMGTKRFRLEYRDGQPFEIRDDEVEKILNEFHKKKDEELEKKRKHREKWKRIHSAKSLEELTGVFRDLGYNNPEGSAKYHWYNILKKH